MTWRIEYTGNAKKTLQKLDKTVSRRIVGKMDNVAKLEDPRSIGKRLVGNFAGYWRYRVGDYRIICNIDDGNLLVLVIEINHRSKIYN